MYRKTYISKTSSLDKNNLSCGIVLVKIPFDIDFVDFKFTKKQIPFYYFNNNIDIEKFSLFVNNIKFLLVQRKNTYEYGSFILGKYRIENAVNIKFMFEQMTPSEINNIMNMSFDDLWKDYWKELLKLLQTMAI